MEVRRGGTEWWTEERIGTGRMEMAAEIAVKY